jgi:predicted lipoprotein with Yx(FWY)xxD motif
VEVHTGMSLTAGSRAILTTVATLVLVAGCAQSGTGTTAPTAAPTTAASPASSAASPAASGGEAYVVNVANAAVGAYLTGDDGKALYLLATDTSGKSTCANDCAANWPPFTLDAGETVSAGTGVTGTVATFTRDDGTTQVTINGLPLYYFAGDTAAGQTNGQGIGGKWYVASPAGTPVGASGAAASPKESKCSGYYCP